MPKTIPVSDIRKEAQKLIESGKMPSLDLVLGAVAHARQQYAHRIKAAQASGPEPEEGAPADFGGPVFPQTNPPTVPHQSEEAPQTVTPTGATFSTENPAMTPELKKAFPQSGEYEQ
jgi:hypothetical protein